MVSSSVDAGLASHEKPITLNMLASRSPNMAGGEEFAGYHAKNLRPGRFTGIIVKKKKNVPTQSGAYVCFKRSFDFSAAPTREAEGHGTQNTNQAAT